MPSAISIVGRTFAGRRARLSLTSGNGGRVTIATDRHRPVPLSPVEVSVRDHFVYLGHRPAIRHVEHLFSALYGLAIFDVRIRLDGREVPFFDGSSVALVHALNSRFRPRPGPGLTIGRKLVVRSGRSFLKYEPKPVHQLVVDMVLKHGLIGRQRLRLAITPRTYAREIASARTFLFTTVRDPRLKKLPPYGFAVTAAGVIGREPARYPDEAVRHKILDLLGDLYVLGVRLCGTITGYNTSHILNHKLVREIHKYR